MRNIAVKADVCGNGYHGWQIQKTPCPWRRRWRKAIATVVCHAVKMRGRGQEPTRASMPRCISPISTSSTIPMDRLPLAVNTRLPDDIVWVRATEVGGGFQRHWVVSQEGVHLPHL